MIPTSVRLCVRLGSVVVRRVQMKKICGERKEDENMKQTHIYAHMYDVIFVCITYTYTCIHFIFTIYFTYLYII